MTWWGDIKEIWGPQPGWTVLKWLAIGAAVGIGVGYFVHLLRIAARAG